VLDRLDLQIEVPAITAGELLEPRHGEASAVVRARGCAARANPKARGALNALFPAAASPSTARSMRWASAWRDAVDRGGMSARAAWPGHINSLPTVYPPDVESRSGFLPLQRWR